MRPILKLCLAAVVWVAVAGLGGPAPASAAAQARHHVGAATTLAAAVDDEGGHVGAAAEAAGGEGQEGGPVIENWWSWNYGPGKEHKNPPFAFALLNFLIYGAIMYRLFGQNLREYMHGRHLQVRRALDEAAEIQKKAQEELDRYQARIGRIDTEVSEMLAQVRKEAEAERARIIAAAEAQAAQLRKDAEAQIQFEIEQARKRLQHAAAAAALDAAEKIVRSQVNDGDQKRLVDDYVGRIETLANTNPNKGRPPGAPASPFGGGGSSGPSTRWTS